MTLSSEIIGVQDIAAGEVVGYGSRFQATGRCASAWWPAAMRTAIRAAPLGTPVLVDGVRTRLVGRVSMDMLTVDLTDLPQAQIGSKVVLWGRACRSTRWRSRRHHRL
jgi:alanine racemase